MPKGKIQFVPLKEVFSEWRKFQKGDQGFALVVSNGRIRIEVLNKINESCSGRVIFLGELKRPTMRVGFLNACLAKICPSDPEKIKIPILSRLEVEKVDEYFRMLEGLKIKISKLDYLIELKLFKEGIWNGKSSCENKK